MDCQQWPFQYSQTLLFEGLFCAIGSERNSADSQHWKWVSLVCKKMNEEAVQFTRWADCMLPGDAAAAVPCSELPSFTWAQHLVEN